MHEDAKESRSKKSRSAVNGSACLLFIATHLNSEKAITLTMLARIKEKASRPSNSPPDTDSRSRMSLAPPAHVLVKQSDLSSSSSITSGASAVTLHSASVQSRKRPVEVISTEVTVGSSDVSEIGCSVPLSNNRPRAVSEGTSSLKKRCTQPAVPVTHANSMLLSQPSDTGVLSPLHVFIRQQIEVFAATPVEMSQPAPGRKNRIQLHQVGLRCIHCRDLPSKDRVKRAVCYPTSVGRVYHSVSDMKFDHFGSCKGLPVEIKDRFFELKAEMNSKKGEKKSSSSSSKTPFASTAQYYHDSARRMGMCDGKGAVFMASHTGEDGEQQPVGSNATEKNELEDSNPAVPSVVTMPLLFPPLSSWNQAQLSDLLSQRILLSNILQAQQNSSAVSQAASNQSGLLLEEPRNRPALESKPSPLEQTKPSSHHPTRKGSTTTLLCSPSDADYLNGIHCFVRKHVEVFAATEEDVKAPAPGRRTRIVQGQVGLRCIHCASLPNKSRVKRSYCYPPTVGGIYHAVSNMKFDHFGICRGLPQEARQEFTKLRSACTRRGKDSTAPKKTAKKGMTSSSTAQYYYDTAAKLGLVDTETGIRFQKADSPVTTLDTSTDSSSDGITALMIAATNPQLQASFRQREAV